MACMTVQDFGQGRSREPVIWGNVPQRNKNFTGRGEILELLRQQASARVAVVSPEKPPEPGGNGQAGQHRDVTDELLPRALHGLGGVGKTTLAVEYAHRYRGDYDLVWWIAADEIALVRASLAALADRLGLRSTSVTGIEGAATAVMDALRRGEPYRRWLLVYDNADQPEEIGELIPGGPGDVIITSRNNRWAAKVETVEVDVFSRTESTEFLSRRVSTAITESDAGRLAQELGDLPLALEQAGALQAETGMSADEYLQLLSEQPTQIMAEGKSADYPRSMTAAWMLSVSQLKQQLPQALDLLRCCAFFGPDPIPRDVFRRGNQPKKTRMSELIADPILLSRAIRELGRFALVKIDAGRSIAVHRLVQTLLRDELSPEDQAEFRHEVHLILAAAAPENPDDEKLWPRFNELVAHVAGEATDLAGCRDPEVRAFALKMVRYFYRSGDHASSRAFAERFVSRWIAESGPDDENVLDGQRHLGNALRELGQYARAYEVINETFGRARLVLGEQNPLTLALRNSLGADLRARGEFAAARELDEETLALHREFYGDDDPHTFRAMNNLALDLGLNSENDEARELHRQTFLLQSDDTTGRVSSSEVVDSWNGLARAVRLCGDFRDARDLGEEALDYGRANLGDDHILTLRTAIDLSIALRRMGTAGDDARTLAQETYETCRRRLGLRQPDTMAAAISLVNTQRQLGTLDPATIELAETTVQRYTTVFSPLHPYYFGCLGNLALLRRASGDAAAAREIDEKALSGLDETLTRDHLYSLSIAIHLASDLAALMDPEGARALDEDTWRRAQALLGENDPLTLACAANLSLDLRAMGDTATADDLLKDALARYRETGHHEYQEARAAAAGERVDFEFDPPGV